MKFTPIIISALLWPSLSTAQMADVQCDDSARLTATLTEVLGATRQGLGLCDPETTLEIWVQARNNDWFVVQNYANGTSCIVAMGEFWESAMTGPA